MAQYRGGTLIFKWDFTATVGGIGTYDVQTCSFGSYGFEDVAIDYLAGKSHVASKINIGECSVTIRGTNGGSSLMGVLQWAMQVGKGDWTDIAVGYKKSVSVKSSGGYGVEMSGCYPSQVELGEGDYSASDLQQATLTLQVDEIE